MSEENLEIVRHALTFEARRGDPAPALAAYDREVEWDVSRSPFGTLTGRRPYRGHEGLRSFFRRWYEAWENVEADCGELIDAGDQVISVVTNRGRGRASGVEVELTQYAVWTIREGKIVRVVWVATREDALEAAGLGE